jgi:hypothetical protein
MICKERDFGAPGPTTSYDFHLWRGELTTFEAIGAASRVLLNVVSDDGMGAHLQGSEISATALEIVPVASLLGRSPVRADELSAHPDVVVGRERPWIFTADCAKAAP